MDEKRGRAVRTEAERSAEWSQNIKIAAGWVCQDCGFLGQLDKEFMDSHHIKSKSKFPKLQYSLNNGRCLDLLCHIRRHLHEPLAALLIVVRLIAFLVKRLGRGDYRDQANRKSYGW